MKWGIKIISKTLMTNISHISWWWCYNKGGYDKGFYGNEIGYWLCDLKKVNSAFTIYSKETKNPILPRFDHLQGLLNKTSCQFKANFYDWL